MKNKQINNYNIYIKMSLITSISKMNKPNYKKKKKMQKMKKLYTKMMINDRKIIENKSDSESLQISQTAP